MATSKNEMKFFADERNSFIARSIVSGSISVIIGMACWYLLPAYGWPQTIAAAAAAVLSAIIAAKAAVLMYMAYLINKAMGIFNEWDNEEANKKGGIGHE